MSDPLPRLLGHVPRVREGDGFGQSWRDDWRYRRRLRRLRRRSIVWCRPTASEVEALAADAFLSRFADYAVALAEVDALACVVLERVWSGWPDPPTYALFAFSDRIEGGGIEIAADFDFWPKAWTFTA